jgi:hypothetical protein
MFPEGDLGERWQPESDAITLHPVSTRLFNKKKHETAR